MIHFKTVLNYWWPQSKKRFIISTIEKVRKVLRKLILCLCMYFNFWLFPSHSNARNHYPPILSISRLSITPAIAICYFIFKIKQGILNRVRELSSSICYTSVESAQWTLSKDELRWVSWPCNLYTLDWWCPSFCNGYKFWGRNLPEQTKFLYCIDTLSFIYLFLLFLLWAYRFGSRSKMNALLSEVN